MGDDRFIERIEGKEEKFWPTIYDISIEDIALEVSSVAGIA